MESRFSGSRRGLWANEGEEREKKERGRRQSNDDAGDKFGRAQ
jgi:hypothetical protein